MGSISATELPGFPYMSTSPITHFPPGQDQALVSEARQQLLPQNLSLSGACGHSQGEAKENKALQERKPSRDKATEMCPSAPWSERRGAEGWGKTEKSIFGIASDYFVTP